jgi:hypothetical protein
MSRHFKEILGAGILVSLLAGCTGDPAAPADGEGELEGLLAQLVAEANSAGDVDAAAAFGDGLRAVRLGVRPSELPVTVNGETSTYRAIVTGVSQETRDGGTVLRRSLIAWSGERPRAVLQVTSFSDQAEFGYPADVLTREDRMGRARGTWVNRAREVTFVATSGTASLVLGSTGEQCPNLPEDPEFRCVVARYQVAVGGVFHLLPQRDSREVDPRTAVEIRAAGGVAGVVVSRVN